MPLMDRSMDCTTSLIAFRSVENSATLKIDHTVITIVFTRVVCAVDDL